MNEKGFVTMVNIFIGAVAGFTVSLVVSTFLMRQDQIQGKPFRVGKQLYVCAPVIQEPKPVEPPKEEEPQQEKQEKQDFEYSIEEEGERADVPDVRTRKACGLECCAIRAPLESNQSYAGD